MARAPKTAMPCSRDDPVVRTPALIEPTRGGGENLPGSQVSHCRARNTACAQSCLFAQHEDAPGPTEKFPARQSEHALDPASASYLPAGHSEHEDAPVPTEKFPAGQSEHALDPASVSYLPAGHSEHVALANDVAPV